MGPTVYYGTPKETIISNTRSNAKEEWAIFLCFEESTETVDYYIDAFDNNR